MLNQPLANIKKLISLLFIPINNKVMDINYTNTENDTTYDKYYETLSDQISDIPILGVSRFNNINGITCYINSILHILQQIPNFVKYIYECKFKKNLKEPQLNSFVIYELYNLFKTSIDNENSIITPTNFKNIIGQKNDMWDEMNQQDSQEFFSFLISQLKEEVGQKVNFIPGSSINEFRSVSNSIDNIIATNSLSSYQSFEYSELTEMFDGLFENICSCSCCKSTNLKFEPFLTLAVDIHDNLYECLDNLCNDQQLDIDNKLTCGFCGISNRAFKKTLLWKTPKILVIHIKRFGFGEQKITTNVDYPIKNLDLTKYIDPKSPFRNKCKYDLIGVNLHLSLGESENINAGHYISLIKNKNNHKWYVYNDSDEPEIITEADEIQTNDAYLLFYYRHN